MTVITIDLSINGCLHWKNRFDERKEDRLIQKFGLRWLQWQDAIEGTPLFPSLSRNKIKGVSACRVPKSVICVRSACPRVSVRVKTLHNEVCCSVVVVWYWNGFLDNANERNTRWRRRGHEWRRVREQLSAIKTAPRVKPYREFVERGHLTSVGHRYKEVSNQDGDGHISLF